jgi:hypothetical protein
MLVFYNVVDPDLDCLAGSGPELTDPFLDLAH